MRKYGSYLIMICDQISSDINELNGLHSVFPWIPNKDMIRPSVEELRQKAALANIIAVEWGSMRDYILHTVFRQSYVEVTRKKFVPDSDVVDHVFEESQFRYDLPSTANHFVLWFSKVVFRNGYAIHKDLVNEIIVGELKKRCERFDFAWYINPKPSVPDFFHVQVFWIAVEVNNLG